MLRVCAGERLAIGGPRPDAGLMRQHPWRGPVWTQGREAVQQRLSSRRRRPAVERVVLVGGAEAQLAIGERRLGRRSAAPAGFTGGVG